MDSHIKDYFRQSSGDTPAGNFHKVIELHNAPDMDWGTISQQVPNLPRGWFELSHLSSKDRVEFTRDFWVAKMPYHPKLCEFLMRFFDTIEDIGIFITQQKFDDPFKTTMVYSLKQNEGFYRGAPPCSENDLLEMKNDFPDYLFPNDYLAFLQIHDGFWKTTDCTGLTVSKKLKETYLKFQELLAQQGGVSTASGLAVDPKSLIPFYESFGMPFYQCFWDEWHPENEMGNVYYSGSTNTVSDVNKKDPMAETMAFPTFTDWLVFYLETIA